MSHPPQEPTGSHTPTDDADPTYTGMPGWVKWFVIALVVVVLALLVGKLAGGEHGPGRHASAHPAAQTQSISASLR